MANTYHICTNWEKFNQETMIFIGGDIALKNLWGGQGFWLGWYLTSLGGIDSPCQHEGPVVGWLGWLWVQ